MNSSPDLAINFDLLDPHRLAMALRSADHALYKQPHPLINKSEGWTPADGDAIEALKATRSGIIQAARTAFLVALNHDQFRATAEASRDDLERLIYDLPCAKPLDRMAIQILQLVVKKGITVVGNAAGHVAITLMNYGYLDRTFTPTNAGWTVAALHANHSK
ncbi:hypothetical protein COY07_03535 [Candidatus Peregrinibacteria bacterium CG_4_10_14_0_2_um_filter_43_11]|nr:MAG: hypothetical protein COY07_03535 [Candidatus Peregrinibacteria bacterium CG_4_10_14_0_2_um_filter_43_11]